MSGWNAMPIVHVKQRDFTNEVKENSLSNKGFNYIIFVHLKSSVDPSALRDKVIFANWQRNRRKPEELNAGKKVNSRKEKYEKAIAALTEMEKRAVMAESMEEATLHYHSGQNKAKPSLSPRYAIAFLNYRY
ncbi:uncharacterized protein [Gossypium hirsutum]|uniref:Uncharacterized protein n=1 Tax=Gossypium hirsutum TaxID=3635 RepID=A0ABM3A1D3_GOSHI|nr:uncharacterized protein LOC107897252 [Gossypium hirsutum]